jgi:hypothetical protein
MKGWMSTLWMIAIAAAFVLWFVWPEAAVRMGGAAG